MRRIWNALTPELVPPQGPPLGCPQEPDEQKKK